MGSKMKILLRRATMSYHTKKVEKIRQIVGNNKYSPIYDEKKWKYCKVNCYAYALNIPVSDRKKLIWIPGCISNEQEEKSIFSSIELIERIKKDLEFLNFSYREEDANSPLLNGEWRIAIYYGKAISHDWPIDFHISRQDADGIWSEKPSWKGKVKKVGEKINKPCDLSKHRLYLAKVLIVSKK